MPAGNQPAIRRGDQDRVYEPDLLHRLCQFVDDVIAQTPQPVGGQLDHIYFEVEVFIAH
jgi:hypothetical protein